MRQRVTEVPGAGEGEGGTVLRQWQRADRRDEKVTAPLLFLFREQREEVKSESEDGPVFKQRVTSPQPSSLQWPPTQPLAGAGTTGVGYSRLPRLPAC